MNYLKDIEHFPQFDNLELIANQVVEGFITGLHKSPFHGFSVEFAEHSLYNKGESTKHIDWKLYARTEKLFVKKYEEETNLRCHILLDISSSMLFPYGNFVNKQNFSIYLASALVYLMRRQRDAVGLTCFDSEIKFHINPKLSYTHLQVIYNQLRNFLNSENNKRNARTNTAELLHMISEMTHKRSLFVLFTDLFTNNRDNLEELFSAFQHLKYNKNEVIIFHVCDRKHEEEFEFSNRPIKFVDLENGEVLKINPSLYREEYILRTKKYFEEIKVKCLQFGIDFVEADINKNFDEVLLSYLLKRQKNY